ncbi:hypothetical protein KHS38_01335 [Mucilaginibacter sp. Bleaf8]|uniref:hypothetical protein n=1 Tax=Mucilaginibacter sp. Bleaf8 TaxID=2834430 RepID=UPI001BD11E16|nr:hypothetical protein [Mucilaginibacter sp. Bleaf8]MBS7563033.1 hypothetical protein [Mucilaginibacter sp. Bleaf8]
MSDIFKSFAGRLSITSIILLTIFLASCSEPADKFFGTAVLNTNTINDFGTPLLAKHINDETIEFPDIPSSKKKGNEALIHVQNSVLYMEKSLKDIKALSAGDKSRATIKAQAIALYEFVIPIYKNEYTAYAKLCDAKAPQVQKDEIIKSIAEKYNARFEELFTTLIDNGKAFAREHDLKVNWN